MSGFQVGVAALSGPTQRLKQISLDLAAAGSGAATAASSGGGAAGDPAVGSAAAVFEAGVRAALGTLGDDAGLLGDRVQRAGISYETTDSTAMPTGSTAPGGTPAASDTPARSGSPAPGDTPARSGSPAPSATPAPSDTSTDPTVPFTGPSTAPTAPAAPGSTAPTPAAGMCGAGSP